MTPAERKAKQRRREKLGVVLVQIGRQRFEVPIAAAYRIAETLKRFAVE